MTEINILIVSAGAESVITKKDEIDYAVKFNENYAQRFIKHIENNESICTACGDDCMHCRLGLVDDLSNRIIGHLKLPRLTDQFIDDPEDYLPAELPAHDLTIAINIHSDLLMEIPALAAKAGSKALIVPVEDPDWLGGWVKARLEESCADLGLEFAAPKPFCNLTGDGYVHIKKFIEEFKVGRPEIELTIEKDVITHVDVVTSAPCGATYYLARIFEGRRADETILGVACKGLSSYPCTASTKVDPEFKDSITHKSNYIMMDVLREILEASKIKA